MADLEGATRTCTRCGDGDLYPRRCSQCGQRWADQACGPTHALITEELGIGDLRREVAHLATYRESAIALARRVDEVFETFGLSLDTPWPTVLATIRRQHQMLQRRQEERGQQSGTPDDLGYWQSRADAAAATATARRQPNRETETIRELTMIDDGWCPEHREFDCECARFGEASDG